jgi:hypothetical protein
MFPRWRSTGMTSLDERITTLDTDIEAHCRHHPVHHDRSENPRVTGHFQAGTPPPGPRRSKSSSVPTCLLQCATESSP